MRCIIFDLDGTLFDASHRMHFIKPPIRTGAADVDEAIAKWKPNWDAFFDACVDDEPIRHVVSACRAMHHVAQVIFVSGRSDRVRDETTNQLRRLGLLPSAGLYMRKHGDHRPDHVVKLEILGELRAKDHEVLMAFDDRDQVVKMWRANGVPCFQVAEGEF